MESIQILIQSHTAVPHAGEVYWYWKEASPKAEQSNVMKPQKPYHATSINALLIVRYFLILHLKDPKTAEVFEHALEPRVSTKPSVLTNSFW